MSAVTHRLDLAKKKVAKLDAELKKAKSDVKVIDGLVKAEKAALKVKKVVKK